MDSEAVCQHLFTRTPSELFHSPTLAFEFVQFCRDNLPQFGRNLRVLRLSFPNLFKARSRVPEQGCTESPGSPFCRGALGRVLAVTTGLGAGGLGCRAEGEVGCPGVSTSHR